MNLAEIEERGSLLIKELQGVKTLEELELNRVKLLGKKGEVSGWNRGLGSLSPEEKPKAGALINQIRTQIETFLNEKKEQFEEGDGSSTGLFDFSLPGRNQEIGGIHPLNQTIKSISGFFADCGYFTADGFEIETDFYNFEALNIPPEHPSRDMQDTFFLPGGLLLRTQTSGVQIRTMEKLDPPFKMIAPGRVFRKDHDITHSPVFHQVEGLAVGERVTFSDLRGTLFNYLRWQFGEKTGIRFRPSFFPFTEPSAEVDIECIFCKGRGCRVCSGSGWLEILGCGMVDPEVFKNVGWDPEKITGFAFGLGVERIAMLTHGISDIRIFFENDVRFLRQF